MAANNAKGAPKFVRVRTSTLPPGFFSRNTPGLLLYKSGRAVLNVGATELLEKLARDQKLDPKQAVLGLYVAKAEGLVSVYVEKPGDEEGQVGVRWLKAKSPKAAFLMGGLLEEYPELKANYSRDCKVSREVDATGIPHLVIPLGSALRYVGTQGSKDPKAAETAKDSGKSDSEKGDGTNTSNGAAAGHQQ